MNYQDHGHSSFLLTYALVLAGLFAMIAGLVLANIRRGIKKWSMDYVDSQTPELLDDDLSPRAAEIRDQLVEWYSKPMELDEGAR